MYILCDGSALFFSLPSRVVLIVACSAAVDADDDDDDGDDDDDDDDDVAIAIAPFGEFHFVLPVR